MSISIATGQNNRVTIQGGSCWRYLRQCKNIISLDPDKKSLNAYVNDLIAKDMETAREKQSINVHNSNGVVIGDNNKSVIVGDVKGNVKL